MARIVQKYGGTSVENTDRIRKVAERILRTQKEGNEVAAVISAMGGVTDALLSKARHVSSDPPVRELDMLLATGEQESVALVAMAIWELGGKAISFSGGQAGFVTDENHSRARIANIKPDRVNDYLKEGFCVIVAGFQGHNSIGDVTTMGRGGSDLSAIALAAALKADVCQILTDVDGVYTCDPRVVPDARKIDEICYDEMLEMASSGSKVMQARSVEFAKKYNVVFEVRNSMNPNPGTTVSEEKPYMESIVVRGVSLERDQAKITVRHVPDEPGYAARIFNAVAEAEITIDMIVQNVSESGLTDISFTLNEVDLGKANKALAPVIKEMNDEVEILAEAGIAKVSAVGIGMRSHSGVAARMFSALAAANINIRMISTSEIKTAAIVDEAAADDAARAVHAEFHIGDEE